MTPRSLLPVAGSGVALLLAATACSAAHVSGAASTSAPAAPSAPLGAATTSLAPASAPPTTSSTAAPPTSKANVFAYVDGDAVEVRSADTGALVRTVATFTGDEHPSSADIGSSGRYVYIAYGTGAERVPLGGGAARQLPVAAGTVDAVYADPADVRVEETLRGASDVTSVHVLTVGGTSDVALGGGTAAGWTANGAQAYVETVTPKGSATQSQTAPDALTLTAVDVANPAMHGYTETFTSPAGQLACGTGSRVALADPTHVGYAVGGCGSNPALEWGWRLIVDGRPYSYVPTSFPTDLDGFFVLRAQYTPAGDTVFELTHQDCEQPGGSDPYAVLHGTGDEAVRLPLGDVACG